MSNLNEKEINSMNNFISKHSQTCKLRCPLCGQHTNEISFTISLHQTGIGQKATIKCNACSTLEDITDYGSW